MAHEMPVQRSFLAWILAALGLKYAILIPLAALIAFTLALILVMRGKGWSAGAALVLIVLAPFLVGIFGAIEGAFRSYMVIAQSDVAPKPSAVAEGISTALVAPMVGMLLMAPAYAVATLGSFIRGLSEEPSQLGKGKL